MRLKDLETWFTPADAAREIGISRQAVHKRLDEGKMRGVKTRAGWLIDPDAVARATPRQSTGKKKP